MDGGTRVDWTDWAVVIIFTVLFMDEPDIFDAARKIALDYAGIEEIKEEEQ